MTKKQAKILLIAALIVYLGSFLIINWNDVSWIFNSRVVFGIVSDFFNRTPSIDASAMKGYFHPNTSLSAPTAKEIKNAKTSYTDKQSVLEIPKLSISAPIVFTASTDKDFITKQLDSGVIYYPGSVYPAQVGQIIILGHSAPAGWPKIKYDWVFTDLDKLNAGDRVLIDFNSKQYTYVVKQRTIIQPGAEVPVNYFNGSNNILTLISCWPPGRDYQRIVVQAELQIN